MARIVKYDELRLDDLVIGKAQVRTGSFGDIDELAASIETLGLLQPIVVCESAEPRKWEILTGQRRFLAHKHLGKETISAAILDARVSEGEAKAISITENLVRRKLDGKELIEGITFLYNLYGTQKAVVEATGLKPEVVRTNVKYPRLVPELKTMVDEGTDIKVALKAQDASTEPDGSVNVRDAVRLAQAMGTMPGVQQKKLVEVKVTEPKKSVDELIERAKGPDKVVQIVTTVTLDVQASIRQVATEEGTNQDEAAALLIEEALSERGLA